MEELSFTYELSEAAREKKEALVASLKKDARVLSFLKENGLDESWLLSHSGMFQQWLQTLGVCAHCQGLRFCRFQPQGHYLDLAYDGLLTYAFRPCAYHKDERMRSAHAKHYCVMDFDRRDLPIDLTTLPLQQESKEYREVVLHVLSHLLEGASRGIYLCGPPGVGKTYLCIGITNYYARAGKRCAFVNVPHLISSLKRLFQDSDAMEALLSRIAHAEIAVFDDIGGESVTPWSRDDVLLPLLDERMNAHRPTYFTSNYTMGELEARYALGNGKNAEPVAALRLLERVKALSGEKILKGRSRR